MKKIVLLISLLTVGTATAQSPVAYYPFNGNANDESGNGYHGTVVGATLTTDRFGNTDAAYAFSGVGRTDSIDCGYIPELNSAPEFTVSCWASQTALDLPKGIWTFRNTNNLQVNTSFLQLRTYSDGNVWAYQPGGFVGYDYSTLVGTNEWHHYAMVFSNSSDSTWLYIDGTQVSSISSANIFMGDPSFARLFLGIDAVNYYAGECWNGKLDDFYIYDVALTPQQVDSLYKLPNPNAGLVAHYPFNGNANDESGSVNIHNGSVSGATLANDRFGNTNSAYSFNGTSDFIQVAHHSDISLDEQEAISTSFWINQSNVNADGNLNSVINKYADSGSEQYGFWTIDTSSVVAGRSINQSGAFDTVSYVANEWYHVVSTFNRFDKTMRIYVNGVLKLEFFGTSTIYSFTSLNSDLFFGAQNGSSRFYEGLIDDIYIYNYELSQAEIDDLYNAPNPTISVGETSSLQFSLYPNPANNFIKIRTESEINMVTIYNLIGESVSTSRNETQINIETLPAGTYLIEVNTDSGKSTQKFIKK